jgi:hypothetical protein
MVKQTESCIAVIGGGFFDLLNPEVNDYDIEVIAHSLARINRYTGHFVTDCYSVAEHSVLVSLAVDPRYALEGLLHDANEAFTGDVSSPLKRLLPDYKRIEEGIQAELAKRFGLVYPFPKEVHEADKRLYWSERATVAPGNDKLWHQDLRASRKVTPVGWTPSKAKKEFLKRYKELVSDRDGSLRPEGTSQSKAA